VKENAEVAKQLLDQAQEEVDTQWERLELYKNL
jgi:pyruvate-ferredoxin/flavodoxin oxidoreductase